MDAEQQAAGEKRVMEYLIDPLLGKGLARPKGFTKVTDFEAMVAKVLCPKLAYMSALNLAALEEQISANPVGKNKDQMPIPNDILRDAAKIQSPDAGASPLVRAVFAAALGRDAMAGNWGPELRRFLRNRRKWPTAVDVQTIKQESETALKRLADIEGRNASGSVVSQADLTWVASRAAALETCREIVEMVKLDGAEA
ncbi:hypothetical protein KL867_17675 [Ruegeria litorea]|uniref:Uncharacterized protein n=1 Tax=Falsiruegeria litorea TaxID=1280831 RepID=A0ABS5WUT6_9RHOB|nr:hypothetical protein [Falsiruegeria litorea]MBT3142902.1 hypothetical protein [Falsiruegeria litorea]